MLLMDLRHVMTALVAVGMDCGASVAEDAEIPPEWHSRARVAEAELARLTSEELLTLATGEETEQAAIAGRCPAAHLLLADAFDGDLSEVVFRSWRDALDARAAEMGLSREEMVRRHEAASGPVVTVRGGDRDARDAEISEEVIAVLGQLDERLGLSTEGAHLAVIVTRAADDGGAATSHWTGGATEECPEMVVAWADMLLRHWLPRMTVPDARRRAEAALEALGFEARSEH